MLNEDYIASGMLELYAAGGLSAAEREEVERRAAASPEIRAALEEANSAMEAYASLYAVRPRTALKDRVMQGIASPDLAAPIASPEQEAIPLHPRNQESQHRATPYKWMLAASLALFLLSGALCLYFYNRWQEAEQQLAGVLASEQRLAENFRNASLQVSEQEQVLAILRNPDFTQIILQEVANKPDARMTVYWNASQRQVYVDQVALPAPPSGRQYQLWALQDGQPIDAGMLETATGEAGLLQRMKDIGAAQAFAVTLEPEGGSASPTLEQLTVMGEVGS